MPVDENIFTANDMRWFLGGYIAEAFASNGHALTTDDLKKYMDAMQVSQDKRD